jgi:hypothetical protein
MPGLLSSRRRISGTGGAPDTSNSTIAGNGAAWHGGDWMNFDWPSGSLAQCRVNITRVAI